jgi:hypothetical protein
VLRAQAEGNQQSTGIERMGKHEEYELPIRGEVTRVNHSHLSTDARAVLRGESLSH